MLRFIRCQPRGAILRGGGARRVLRSFFGNYLGRGLTIYNGFVVQESQGEARGGQLPSILMPKAMGRRGIRRLIRGVETPISQQIGRADFSKILKNTSFFKGGTIMKGVSSFPD